MAMAKGARQARGVIAPVFAARARQIAVMTAGIALIMISMVVAVALLAYHPADPSFDTVTSAAPRNLLGRPGAWLADGLLVVGGWASAALLPPLVIAGARLLRGKGCRKWQRYVAASVVGTLAMAAAIGLALPDADAALPAGTGGAIGLSAQLYGDALDVSPTLGAIPLSGLIATGLLLIGGAMLALGSGLDRADALAVAAWFRRPDEETPVAAPVTGVPRVRWSTSRDAALQQPVQTAAAPRATIVVPAPSAAAPSARRGRRERQPTLGLGDIYELPPLDLLKPAPKGPVVKIDRAALEQNARLLESVLDDFGVKGRIGDVRPGPVVTMYELEPAPGLKASRVIGLSDDIARSMSAVSARVAVVPGRNVIGIELPNSTRQMVTLAELLASTAFDDQSAALPLVLGKNIAGDPVIADLSPMPHLLIAGTTGSGKSVGLNCMILSLLYRLSPAQCRMIMIDPKMLELSVYDRIPHLLSPVVTDPPKAIRALKWAVEQMEDRYRMMSTINVRSLSGFNQRVREAKASGKPFVRKIHTGYDDDGVAIHEEETLDFEILPLIVVVVDELADLMMTAGKEVEFLIQRLAQKARAAGIHLIMATQRPSVDVITGVIKANLPTRISFSVTSKIDSRTILGEQGAEQLLGKGDMLYMPGGKQVIRVHGPFVSDEEVEAVADYCRTQGRPDYVDAVTEEPVDGDGVFGLDLGADGLGGGGEEAETYRKAIMIVAESRKASTSYLQRQLRVGYNNAARLIERMEKDGYVGVADHVGRREVLIDTDGMRV